MCNCSYTYNPPGPLHADTCPDLRREGTTIVINGVPTLKLEHPIATRPQDWAEPARSILFPDRQHV